MTSYAEDEGCRGSFNKTKSVSNFVTYLDASRMNGFINVSGSHINQKDALNKTSAAFLFEQGFFSNRLILGVKPTVSTLEYAATGQKTSALENVAISGNILMYGYGSMSMYIKPLIYIPGNYSTTSLPQIGQGVSETQVTATIVKNIARQRPQS